MEASRLSPEGTSLLCGSADPFKAFAIPGPIGCGQRKHRRTMKRGFSVSTLLSLVTGTLVVVLVTATLVSATSAFKRERDSAQIMSNARVTRDVVMVREALRAEWGVMDTTVRDPVIASPQSLAK